MSAQFKAIDINGDGVITRDELILAYQKFKGVDFNIEEVDEIIKNVDQDGNGSINYSEWLLSAVSKERLLEKNKLQQAFQMFDVNGDK